MLKIKRKMSCYIKTCFSQGYSTDYLIDFSIVTDSKNSSWRVIDIDQVSDTFLIFPVS